MIEHDLCLAWNWEHDADFVALLEAACRSIGLALLQVTPANLAGALQAVAEGQSAFRVLLDRASDSDAEFAPLVRWAQDHAVRWINPHEKARRTWDKATMHHALIGAGLYTPYTIIVPSHEEKPHLPTVDFAPLGDSFAIKPAHGGGGDGVVIEATSMEQVLEARQMFPADVYLLQAHIAPIELGSRQAWFRVIYCAGRVYPCWWDTTTHVYTPVACYEEDGHRLGPLRDMALTIARVCELDLFSTEIALTAAGLFIVVDYVNDLIDLRLQSRTVDGVPDDIVRDIAGGLAALALERSARLQEIGA